MNSTDKRLLRQASHKRTTEIKRTSDDGDILGRSMIEGFYMKIRERETEYHT
jgi:hypothetical protein